jgi:hypothetical protein
MNRRDALKAIGSVATAAATPSAAPKKFGRLTLSGHRQHFEATGETLHVWIDGEDITHCCVEANDYDGTVEILARDHDIYRRFVPLGEMVGPCHVRLRGAVRIAPGKPFPYGGVV